MPHIRRAWVYAVPVSYQNAQVKRRCRGSSASFEASMAIYAPFHACNLSMDQLDIQCHTTWCPH